jgi:hypothetical protein
MKVRLASSWGVRDKILIKIICSELVRTIEYILTDGECRNLLGQSRNGGQNFPPKKKKKHG